MNEKAVYSVQEVSDIRIMRVGFFRPFRWLHQGWKDLMYSPRASLAHGLIITAMGWVVLTIQSATIFTYLPPLSQVLCWPDLCWQQACTNCRGARWLAR